MTRRLLHAAPPLAIAALLGMACASRPPPPLAPPSPVAPPPRLPAKDPQCDADRIALDAAMKASAARPCQTSAGCADVTSPRSFVKALARVVNREDAARLDGEARALLRRCGPSAFYDEGTGSFDVVTPRCTEARCIASVTTYHVDEP